MAWALSVTLKIVKVSSLYPVEKLAGFEKGIGEED